MLATVISDNSALDFGPLILWIALIIYLGVRADLIYFGVYIEPAKGPPE